MTTANKHYIPGYVWHITHRCHKKEFLLTGARGVGVRFLKVSKTMNRFELRVASLTTATPNDLRLTTYGTKWSYGFDDCSPAALHHRRTLIRDRE